MPLDFPDVGIKSFDLRLKRSIAVAESPFTYDQQVYDFGGARWEAEVTLEPLAYSDANKVEAFLIALKGRSGTFRCGNPQHVQSYTVLTSGGSGSIGDEQIGATGSYVPAGNYFSLGNYLYLLTQDFIGTGDMQFQPPLREVIPSGAFVYFNAPKSLWRLATNDIGWSSSSTFTSFTIPMVEAL